MFSFSNLRHLLLTLALIASANPAPAQDPLKTLPNNYKLVLDNADLTVMRVHYGPHEKVPVHDHSNYATIYVYLNDSGEVRLTHDETPPMVITRPPTKLGSFRIAPARPERHSIENLGDQPSDFLRVELKRLPMTGLDKPVRGPAPETLVSGSKEEYTNAELSIHRIVCSIGPACTYLIPASTLLIALSQTAIHADDPSQSFHNHLERLIQSGDVEWEQTAKSIRIQATTNAAAQILQISLTNRQK